MQRTILLFDYPIASSKVSDSKDGTDKSQQRSRRRTNNKPFLCKVYSMILLICCKHELRHIQMFSLRNELLPYRILELELNRTQMAFISGNHHLK